MEIYKEGRFNLLEKYAEKEFGIECYDRFFDLKNFPQLRYRPDFKLSETSAMNVDGLYWHSELQKDKQYHFEMRKQYEVFNLRIFQFRADEVRNKTAIVNSIIRNSRGGCDKIYARKTSVIVVPQKRADQFLETNHLMGTKYSKHIGLEYDGRLVSILSYKVSGKTLKIERFCSELNYVVIGGLSKLLRHLQNQYSDLEYIESWVDLRYGNGSSLEKIGFKATKETLSWKWTDGKETFNRLKCRANMDKRNLSQAEYVKELGWYKIYDAGQRLYRLKV